MKGLIDDSLYRYALAGIKPERHLEADGVTAISFPIRKITVILLVVLVVGKFFAAFFSHLRDDILHIHKVMHWLHRRKVCAAAIIPRCPFLCLLISQTNPLKNSLKLNAASVVLEFNINPTTDAKGKKILSDPNNLLDEGLAVRVNILLHTLRFLL